MNESRNDMSKCITYIVAFSILFTGIFIFFAEVHPLIIFDADDWLFASYTRRATPIWGDWNPTRILPETFMSFCSMTGIILFKPFTNDYIGSLAIAYALAVSVFILLYFVFFIRRISKTVGLKTYEEAGVLGISVLYHFLIYNVKAGDNLHMFAEANVTCMFFYIIPAILNSILVLYLLNNEINLFSKEKLPVNSLLILGIYLAINSNMFQSIILISFAGWTLLENILFAGEKSIKAFIKKNIIWIGMILCWMISLYYEVNGGRADDLSNKDFGKNILACLGALKSLVFERINRTFLLTSFVLIIFGVAVYLIKRVKETKDRDYLKVMIRCSICCVITIVYLILLCAKTSPDYLKRSGVLFGIMFYLLLSVMTSFAYAVSEVEPAFLIVPLFFYIIFNETVNDERMYKFVNSASHPERLCVEIDNDIINQVLNAEDEGKSEVDVYVPVYDMEDNWPVANYVSDFMSNTLYRHGITKDWIKIYIKPSKDMNRKYHMN